MEQEIDEITLDFLEETIEILEESLNKLKKLHNKAEEVTRINTQNNELLKKVVKEIVAVRKGVIG